MAPQDIVPSEDKGYIVSIVYRFFDFMEAAPVLGAVTVVSMVVVIIAFMTVWYLSRRIQPTDIELSISSVGESLSEIGHVMTAMKDVMESIQNTMEAQRKGMQHIDESVMRAHAALASVELAMNRIQVPCLKSNETVPSEIVTIQDEI